MSRDYLLQPFRSVVDLRIDYARDLNPQQHAAVTAPPGPALVLAGAGAGKTRTLIYRVAFLLEQGIPADRILLLTFTNKAAREMMRRVSDLLGGDLAGLWGGTFHAIGNRILRRHAEKLRYPRGYTILDREDARDLIKSCLDDSALDVTTTRFPKADVLGDIFSLAVNTREPVREILVTHYGYFSHLAEPIELIHRHYAERKRAAGVMDFDDLLVFWLQLLEQDPEMCELYQRRFQFLLVDEYQDTNRLQGALIELLAARHHNVMVVGDDSQSIYSWRGADFRNILEFPGRHPDTRTYKIETNYRSTPEILALANAAIAPNTRQFEKQLVASRKSGIKPVLVPCFDSAQQAAFVAQRALELRDEGINLNEMAVLYRSHFHALELQLELTRRNIPFTITSGTRFFEQAHIKDATSFLKLVCNPRDELAFKRCVRLLPGIGGRTAAKLWADYLSRLPAVLDGPRQDHSPIATALQGAASAVPKKSAIAWAQLTVTVAQLENESEGKTVGAMLRLVMEAVYEDYLKAKFTNYRNRREDLDQLAIFADQFPSLEEFLSQLSLLSNLESEDATPTTDDNERIHLSTIHQAKGLEFAVVFVIMLGDGLFPSSRSLEDPDSEEEERRLFYVAVTRAKNELYLSYPLIRESPGGSGNAAQLPSRFLNEIPVELRDEWNLRMPGVYG